MSVGLIRTIRDIFARLIAIQGGAETLESLRDMLAAQLDLARSTQSGDTLMDGTTLVLYEESDDVSFAFYGGTIDWTGLNFGAGEDTTINVDVKNAPGGGYVNIWTAIYLNAALPSPVCTVIPNGSDDVPFGMPLLNVYGIRVTADQAAVGGGWNTLPHEWFDGKRGV